jgi:hypothetical protein
MTRTKEGARRNREDVVKSEFRGTGIKITAPHS